MNKIKINTKFLLLVSLLCFISLASLFIWQRLNPESIPAKKSATNVIVEKPLEPSPTSSMSASLTYEILGNQNSSQSVIGLYLKDTPAVSYSSLALKLEVIDYKPQNPSVKPFLIDESLKTAGVSDHINKWNCQDKNRCFVEIALISLKPEGFVMTEARPLGEILIDRKNLDLDEGGSLMIKSDESNTVGVTVQGEQVIIKADYDR